jgi:hypothetical protein
MGADESRSHGSGPASSRQRVGDGLNGRQMTSGPTFVRTANDLHRWWMRLWSGLVVKADPFADLDLV